MHEGMGMDKVNNIKSAIASANLDVNNSKSVKLAEGRSSSTSKVTPVKQGMQAKLNNSLESKSVATTKTLAETLKTNEEKVRAYNLTRKIAHCLDMRCAGEHIVHTHLL